MWLHVSRRLVLVLICVLGGIVGWVVGKAPIVEGQGTTSNNLQSYIENLKELTLENPGFEVTFQFNKPLLDSQDDWWTVPYIAEDSEINRGFDVVGEDYVCFVQSTGTTPVVLCTPFTNIVSINYTSSP